MVKTVLTIDGMACGMCESHVNDAIRNALRVKKVTSSHAKGETEILSEEPLSEEALLELLQKLVRTAYNEGRDGTPWAKSKARQATRRMKFLKKWTKS